MYSTMMVHAHTGVSLDEKTNLRGTHITIKLTLNETTENNLPFVL